MVGDRLIPHLDEIPHPNHLGLARVDRREPLERVVQLLDIDILRLESLEDAIQGNPPPIAPPLPPTARPSMIDEDLLHRPDGGGKQVRAIVRLPDRPIEQAQDRLVDEPGRIEGMPVPLAGHQSASGLAQLSIECVKRDGISRRIFRQHIMEFVHRPHHPGNQGNNIPQIRRDLRESFASLSHEVVSDQGAIARDYGGVLGARVANHAIQASSITTNAVGATKPQGASDGCRGRHGYAFVGVASDHAVNTPYFRMLETQAVIVGLSDRSVRIAG